MSHSDSLFKSTLARNKSEEHMDETLKQSLLSGEANHGPFYCSQCYEPSSKHPRNWLRRWLIPILTHSAVFIATFITYKWISPYEVIAHHKIGSLSSPLDPYVTFKIDTPSRDYWENKLFMGEPTYESDHAWNALLTPHGFRIFPDEAAALNITNSVSMSNGDFVTIPGFNHNLHCLRRLRQTLFEDYYYPNSTAEQRDHNKSHNIHCLEALRTSVMCNPDLTLLPYFWSNDPEHALSTRPNVVRECVDWETLQLYRQSRDYDRATLVRDEESKDVF